MTDEEPPPSVRRLALVSGRVQGVFFRASTAQQATRLGVTGWAHNRPDGTVEVFACGEPDTVEKLLAWLLKGPPAASVTSVEVSATDLSPPASFTTG